MRISTLTLMSPVRITPLVFFSQVSRHLNSAINAFSNSSSQLSVLSTSLLSHCDSASPAVSADAQGIHHSISSVPNSPNSLFNASRDSSAGMPERSLVELPPLEFVAEELRPLHFTPSSVDDAPLRLFRSQRIQRALGCLPQSVSLPPSLSSSPARSAGQSQVAGQYREDFSATSWNSQGMFCKDLAKHRSKCEYICRLAGQHDVTMLEEIHGDDGTYEAWQRPRTHEAFFSHGPSYGVAGVGMLVKKEFLKKFSSHRWVEIWRGRAAKLELRGAAGSLDLWVVYFHTGARVQPADLDGVLPGARRTCASFAAIRSHMRSRIAKALAPRRLVLSVIAGDFNWCAERDGRRTLATMRISGSRDLHEERHWLQLSEPLGFFEAQQMEFTHRSAAACSRLDRIYLNQHASEQLDRELFVGALDWQRDLSHHRAITISKRLPPAKDASTQGVSPTALRHRDFARGVRLNYAEACAAEPSNTAIRRVKLMKKAMVATSRSLSAAVEGYDPVKSTADKVGICMRYPRAAERQSMGEIS